MHGRKGDPRLQGETEGDGIAVMDLFGDRVAQRPLFVRQR